MSISICCVYTSDTVHVVTDVTTLLMLLLFWCTDDVIKSRVRRLNNEVQRSLIRVFFVRVRVRLLAIMIYRGGGRWGFATLLSRKRNTLTYHVIKIARDTVTSRRGLI